MRTFAFPYALALVPALLVAFLQPVWSRVDEAQHYDVIAHYARGEYPVESLATLTPDTVEIMRKTGIYRWSLPGQQPVPTVDDPAEMTPLPANLSREASDAWQRRHLWWFSYEAMQPPLFYALALPFWIAGKALGGAFGALYAVRAFDAMLNALVAPIALAMGRLLVPGLTLSRRLAAAAIVLLPGAALIGTQVINDTLAVVLSSVALLLALRGLKRGWDLRQALLLGAVMGAAILSKLLVVGIAPAIALAMAWPLLTRQTQPLRQLALMLAAGAAATAVVAPWLILNLQVYGHPIPEAEAQKVIGHDLGNNPRTFSLVYIQASLKHFFTTFWTGEPHNALPFVRLAAGYCGLLTVASGAGVALMILRKRGATWLSPILLAMLVTAVLGQAVWAFIGLYESGIGDFVPGRYAYPALVPTMLLMALGLLALLGQRLLIAGVAGLAVVATLQLGGYMIGLSGQPVERRTAPPASGTEVHQLIGARGTYHALTISSDRIELEPATRATWIHLDVANGGDTPVIWSADPAAADAGRSPMGAFPAYTAFPETLPPHSHYSGWLELRNAPPLLTGNGALYFGDLTDDDYRTIGLVEIDLKNVK